MALYVGDAVSIVVEITDPIHSRRLDDTDDVSVHIDFYAPGKDPKGTPADRATPIDTVPAIYDASAITRSGIGAWVAYQSTASPTWVAGKCAYRVRVSGAYENAEYGAFTLKV